MPDIPYEMKPPYAAKTDCREYHEPIDVVLTWVNGTDPEFLKQLKENEPAKASETGASRFKDMNQLKYAIRSFQKYAPWIRDIILVTNGQGTVFDKKGDEEVGNFFLDLNDSNFSRPEIIMKKVLYIMFRTVKLFYRH